MDLIKKIRDLELENEKLRQENIGLSQQLDLRAKEMTQMSRYQAMAQDYLIQLKDTKAILDDISKEKGKMLEEHERRRIMLQQKEQEVEALNKRLDKSTEENHKKAQELEKAKKKKKKKKKKQKKCTRQNNTKPNIKYTEQRTLSERKSIHK
eukprot:TRINITY_DN13406_c0_g1_i3.p5 TRINITY_DN13406_c0_g1~~TRINITY_DN13406_c0_g1_i3.p5  ORF type:complete len:152 (-),score=49.46 TRINITY_DN13406_c0_g1_i3:13-468(-)